MKANHVTVSVVLPVRNEEQYIAECVQSILDQDYPKEKMEVIFVDGASEDRTVERLKAFQREYPFITILDNPKKTVQYALNIGMKAAKGEYIVRMDAHAEYAHDYVSQCISTLQDTGADDVGGPMVAKWRNNTQQIIAAAYHSPFAMGGGKFHNKQFEGYADTVFLGAYRKDTLEKLGYYDERLPRSEDDDLNFRLIETGGKIYINPAIRSVYYPRDSYRKLFVQYMEYGLWKVAVIKKHKKPARISHLIPLCFVLFLLLFGLGSFFSRWILATFAGILLFYVGMNAYFSFTSPELFRFSDKLRLIWVHFILHLSYGLGFLVGIFRFWGRKF